MSLGMIAVEIPAALAADPKVVPVDLRVLITPDTYTITIPEALVGQRVALAWRETCPNPACDDGVVYGMHPTRQISNAECNHCDGTAARMVVGWTAEVEAVVPIISERHWDEPDPPLPCIVVTTFSSLPLISLNGPTVSLDHLLPLADWSPGRDAIVLRDAEKHWRPNTDQHFTCRPFFGFAKLDEVTA